MNNRRWISAGGILLVCWVGAVAWAGKGKADVSNDRISYLDNGVIRIGMNLDLGGAITYLSASNSTTNLVNSFDWGRQIQMSHYSGPVPYSVNGKEPNKNWIHIGWNPIQSGDCYGNRAKVLEHRNANGELYVKCIPMHWPLNNEPGECVFECWVKLDGAAAQVRSRMINARPDKTQYPARLQELPAIYVNGPWYRLMTYTGDKPFTNDRLEQIPPVFPWAHWFATENWSAAINDEGSGVGIWEPGTYGTSGGFAGKPGAGGPKDSPTAYIAPVENEIIDHNITCEYSYTLIVGKLEEIRKYVYDHATKPAPPDWRFEKDRQHWHYERATDAGWPIQGELNVSLEKHGARLVSPATFWRAADAPKLYIEAAVKAERALCRFYWKRHDENKLSEPKAMWLELVPDEKFHVYEVPLDASAEYRGAITGIMFQPQREGRPGDYIRVKSITCRKPAESVEVVKPSTRP